MFNIVQGDRLTCESNQFVILWTDSEQAAAHTQDAEFLRVIQHDLDCQRVVEVYPVDHLFIDRIAAWIQADQRVQVMV